jgi:hypothetical protein
MRVVCMVALCSILVVRYAFHCQPLLEEGPSKSHEQEHRDACHSLWRHKGRMNEYRCTSKPTQEEIRLKYNRFAPWYDLAEALPEFMGVKNLRWTSGATTHPSPSNGHARHVASMRSHRYAACTLGGACARVPGACVDAAVGRSPGGRRPQGQHCRERECA